MVLPISAVPSPPPRPLRPLPATATVAESSVSSATRTAHTQHAATRNTAGNKQQAKQRELLGRVQRRAKRWFCCFLVPLLLPLARTSFVLLSCLVLQSSSSSSSCVTLLPARSIHPSPSRLSVPEGQNHLCRVLQPTPVPPPLLRLNRLPACAAHSRLLLAEGYAHLKNLHVAVLPH